MRSYHSASGSAAEDLFIDLFSETFGAEKELSPMEEKRQTTEDKQLSRLPFFI